MSESKERVRRFRGAVERREETKEDKKATFDDFEIPGTDAAGYVTTRDWYRQPAQKGLGKHWNYLPVSFFERKEKSKLLPVDERVG